MFDETLPQHPPSDPTAPETPHLGRYPITGRLGEGGMGLVWQVRDSQLGREVAAKVVSGEAEALTRHKFIVEAQVTGQLEHPNIVPVYELATSEEGEPYFTMKRVDGRTFGAILANDRTLSGQDGPRRLGEDLQVFLKVCDAVGYAHSKGVIHRDLKPDNIMVGSFGEVLVLDWGLAKILGTETDHVALDLPVGPLAELASDDQQTLTGTILGTPAYMPPEQALGQIDQLDERSDIYSLGVILYQILTLTQPFGGESLPELLAEVCRAKPIPPSERVDTGIPWELEQVTLKAMARQPVERYQSVEALKRDIEAYLADRLLEAPSYTWHQRLVKWLRTHRHRLVGTVALLAVTALLLGGLRWRQQQQHQEQQAAQQQQLRAGQFARHRADALKARQAENWGATEVAARRALDLRPDAPLRELLAEARSQLAERRRSHARVLSEQKLLEQLKPLITEIAAARSFFYVPRIKIRERLTGVRRALRKISRLADSAEYSEHAEVWHWIGQAQLLLGDERAAEKSLKKAASIDPGVSTTASDLGRLYLRRARSLMISVQNESNSVNIRMRKRRSLTEARRWLERANQVQGLWGDILRSYRLLAQRRYAKAIKTARQSLARHHNLLGTEELWLIIGLASEEQPAKQRAFDKAIRRCPNHAWAHFFRSLTQEPAEGIIADLTRALEINPQLIWAYINRGVAWLDAGNLDRARQDLDRAIALDDQNELAWNNRAAVGLQANQPEQALRDATRALELEPRFPRALRNRGMAYVKLGRSGEAIADLSRAIKLAPDDPGCLIGRGRVYYRVQNLKAALSDFTKAIELNPGNGIALANRALVHADMGHDKQAMADCDAAVRWAPRLSEGYLTRARLRQRAGDLASAQRDLDIVVGLSPKLSLARIWRGVLRGIRGDRDGAIADMRTTLRHDPGSIWAALWLAGLDGQTRHLAPFLDKPHEMAHLVRFYLGRCTAEQVLTAVKGKRSPTGAALGFIGLRAERRGDLEGARRAYQACLATKTVQSAQYLWAQHRLKALRKR